ncbi:MAG: cyclic nucleotide-binding domain-containing protein [Cyanobacteria bacterium P01_H01_bin.121]
MQKLLFVLGELSDDDIDWIVETSTRECIPSGTVLIEEGSPTQKLYILLNGKLDVLVDKSKVATLGMGDIFGEMSFIDSRPPSATVVTAEESVTLSVPQQALKTKLRQDVGFSSNFYRAIAMFLSDRLRAADSQIGYGLTRTYEDTLAEITDKDLIDNYQLARARYDWLMSRLAGSADRFTIETQELEM